MKIDYDFRSGKCPHGANNVEVFYEDHKISFYSFANTQTQIINQAIKLFKESFKMDIDCNKVTMLVW